MKHIAFIISLLACVLCVNAQANSSTPPEVTVSPSSFTMEQGDNMRIDIQVVHKNKSGFDGWAGL